MHSYEDRVRAVELYYRYGKKASMVIRELGYPSIKQLGRWVRIYEETGDLPKGLKSRQRYSQAQKIAAVERYIRWYNEKRIKLSLGAMSPVKYRQHLGITT